MVITQPSQDMTIRIVIQARTSSTRLPGKVLKTIGGLPLAVLVARRASQTAIDVVVATSDDPSDDKLAQVLVENGIKIFRGSLQNVLSRLVGATEDLSDSDVCVRLTADNPVPDGTFIRMAIEQFLSSGQNYISYGNDGQFLPYGLSVEVFRVSGLRSSAASDPDAQTREHVTTGLRSLANSYLRPALPNFDEDLGHLRCTIDTRDDFDLMSSLFAEVSDPIAVGWRDLADKLRSRSKNAPNAQPVLGTVQLGLPYGRTNQSGVPSVETANDILVTAYAKGISIIDTARDYGLSENRIGEAIRANNLEGVCVITKLTPRTQSKEHGSDEDLRNFVEREVDASISALGLRKIPVLLLHRNSDLDFANGVVWRKLLALKSAGKIGSLGCSVQSPAELERALIEPEVHHVQMPFNILDWRWEKSIAGLRFRPDVHVHVRSAFLQGLLVNDDARLWPRLENLDSNRVLQNIGNLVRELGRKSAADLCIAYVRGMSWVNGIVVGVENIEQLNSTFGLWDEPHLSWGEIAKVRAALPTVPAELLNPALWPSA